MNNVFKKVMLVAVVLSALLAVSGCVGYDANSCYESVKSAYPNGEVALIPGEKWRFLVKTEDGDIVYVETMNHLDTNLTQVFTAFRGS